MNEKMQTYHVPVLLNESVDGLNIKPDGTYVDLTFGGGGHSREILRRLGPDGTLIAFDQDEQAYANRPDDDRLIFVRHNFRYIAHFLRYMGIDKVDGVLADLGVSSHHFDAPERGFSFRFDAPLDMRMGQGMTTTAADIVNNYDEKRLASVLDEYGEVKQATRLARLICAEREKKAIETTFQLRDLLLPTVIPPEQNKLLTKVFQALRIEVNGEMDALREMLSRMADIIKKDGRLSVIAYHSLEDRMVKNLIKSGSPTMAEPERDDIYGHSSVPFDAINRKPIVPSETEIQNNSRARSAKLRIAKRI